MFPIAAFLQSLEPKLTDFGMAKQGQEGVSHLSTRVMGTLGYLDPAYMETGDKRADSEILAFWTRSFREPSTNTTTCTIAIWACFALLAAK